MSDSFSTKLFATRRYVYPNVLQTSFAPPSLFPNPNLDAANVDMFTGEIGYNKNKSKLIFGFAYKETDNGLIFNKLKKIYVNNDSTVYFHRYYIRGEYKFNYDNKIIVEAFKGFKDVYASPGSGALVQLFNTFGKFDIYNELIYRAGYTVDYGAGDINIDKGYDYTLAVTYNINKKLKLKLKGENLLDEASKTPIDPEGFIQVPAIERRGILTMEYTF